MLYQIPDCKIDPLLRSQGFLPTLMIVYVRLDLGVSNEVLTNSFAPRGGHQVGLRVTDHHPDQCPEDSPSGVNADAELGLGLDNNNQSMVQKPSFEWPHSVIMDIRPVEPDQDV
jgi:hypothetical protein